MQKNGQGVQYADVLLEWPPPRSYEFWPEEPDGVEVRAGPEAEPARLPQTRSLTPASLAEPSTAILGLQLS